jgi:uncharacterized protein YlxW (UPF0749 family)
MNFRKLLTLVKSYPRTAGAIGLLILIVVVGAYIGIKLRPSAPVGIPQEAVEAHDKAQQDKGAADELRRQLKEQDEELARLRQKNTELEQDLERAKANTAAAKKSYEQSRNTRPRHTPVDSNTSTDSLCTRASRVGISCE